MTDGRVWQCIYDVTRDGIAAYCAATGETNLVFTDLAVARQTGYDDVVAPPMYAAVFSLPAVQQMLADERFDGVRARLLHAAQTFRWTDVAVVAGDRITTAATVESEEERGPHRFFAFRTSSLREDGREVARGEWLTVAPGR